MFLGLTGDGSSAPQSGGTYGIRKASHATAGASASDPFAMNGSGGSSSSSAGHDPFAPALQQQQQADPFGFAPSSQLPPPVVPNDPFSFTQPSAPAAPLPYDPFAAPPSGAGGGVGGSSYDDPFADLVASGRR
jgi:hypothetical protein